VDSAGRKVSSVSSQWQWCLESEFNTRCWPARYLYVRLYKRESSSADAALHVQMLSNLLHRCTESQTHTVDPFRYPVLIACALITK
jgi:hypothetical protein